MALTDLNGNTMYNDLEGQSYAGNQYIFIACIYTINMILMKPIKGTDDANMIAVFKEIYKELEIRNCKPKLHVLDNQCLKAVKSYIQKEKIKIQLVEPSNHRVNSLTGTDADMQPFFNQLCSRFSSNVGI